MISSFSPACMASLCTNQNHTTGRIPTAHPAHTYFSIHTYGNQQITNISIPIPNMRISAAGSNTDPKAKYTPLLPAAADRRIQIFSHRLLSIFFVFILPDHLYFQYPPV